MNLHRIKSLKVKSVALLATVFVLATAGPANAGPFDPAYRGDNNSVHAIFDWVSIGDTDWNTTLFDPVDSNFPLDPTNPSASDNGEDTTIILPNFIDPLELKLMRVQMFFDGPVDGSLIDMQVVGHDPNGAVANETDRSLGSSQEHFIDWEIRPNPDWEEIFIFGNTSANILPGNLLTIEIDTVSFIPEPGTIVLAALGLMGIGCHRKKRA